MNKYKHKHKYVQIRREKQIQNSKSQGKISAVRICRRMIRQCHRIVSIVSIDQCVLVGWCLGLYCGEQQWVETQTQGNALQ